MSSNNEMKNGSATPNVVQRPFRPFERMVLPVVTQEMLEKSAAQRAIQSNIISKNTRNIGYRAKKINAHRRAYAHLDPIAEVKRRGITRYRVPNIPVQQVRQSRRVKQQPKRLIHEIAANKKKGTRKTKSNRGNHSRRLNRKVPKFVRTNNLGNPVKRSVKKMPRKAPTNGNTNMMAAAAPVVRDDEDRNPFAVRLGAIKQKYVPQIEAKELQREQALAAHDYKTARILEKEINDLKEAKNKEQQTAREAVVAEKRQADALANLLGAKAVIGGPVPSAAAPAYAPTGFFMQPAATGWAQPTGGIGAPPPAPYFTAGPGFGQYPPPTGGIGAPPFYSTGGPGGLGGEGR